MKKIRATKLTGFRGDYAEYREGGKVWEAVRIRKNVWVLTGDYYYA